MPSREIYNSSIQLWANNGPEFQVNKFILRLEAQEEGIEELLLMRCSQINPIPQPKNSPADGPLEKKSCNYASPPLPNGGGGGMSRRV